MKKIVFLLVLLFSLNSTAQDIFGKWETIDAKGVSKCVVDIYKQDGKVFGKIIEILVEEDKDAICTKCEGNDKNKPVLGFVLIKNLEKDGKYYKNGTIFDPEHGEEFRCRLALKNENTLQVRGYLAFLYSTQYWKRIK